MDYPDKRKKRFIIICFSLAVLLIAGAAVISYVNGLRDDPLRAFMTPTPAASPTPTEQQSTAAERLALLPAPTAATPPPAHVLGANTINLVLMGLDSDTEREAKNRGWRSDTIAVLVIDVDQPACTVLSIPRDTRARVRKLNSKGGVISTQYNKVNAAFHFGGGPSLNGHENLIYSLERMLFDNLQSDVNMSYYASIDMDGIARFADAVEGVPLTLPYNIAGFGKKDETIVLAGDNARKFVRLRHGITGGSDIGRIDRQQLFLRAFAEKVQQMGAGEAVAKLWSSLAQYVNTNLNTEQILVLGNLLSKLDLEKVDFITLPGRSKNIDGRSYYVPDTKKIRELALTLWGE